MVAALVGGLALAMPAWAASVEEDVERFIVIFQGDKSEHSASAESLSWMGLSDPRLFDVIEQQLAQDYPVVDLKDKRERQRIAWYIRALGFSGLPKYAARMQPFRDDRNFAIYAKDALRDQPIYARWNPLISNRASFDPKLSDHANRIANMLRADDFMLKRLGAKRSFHDAVRDPQVLEVLARQIQASYQSAGSAESDAVAWMVIALAASRKEEYKQLVTEVSVHGSTNGIKDHARRSLSTFYGNT